MIWYWVDDPYMCGDKVSISCAYADILMDALEAWLNETV